MIQLNIASHGKRPSWVDECKLTTMMTTMMMMNGQCFVIAKVKFRECARGKRCSRAIFSTGGHSFRWFLKAVREQLDLHCSWTDTCKSMQSHSRSSHTVGNRSVRQELSRAASVALRLTGDRQQPLTTDGLLIRKPAKAVGSKPSRRSQRWHRILSLLGYYIYIPVYLSLLLIDSDRKERH